MAEAIKYTMAKAPRWPHRQCVGHHLGKEPRQSRIPTKFPKHNKEMTRKRLGGLYTDTVYYIYTLGQMTNCQWPIIKEQLVVCTKLIFILRHKFLKKLVVKSLHYSSTFVWTNCYFYWTINSLGCDSTELSLLLNCQFYWAASSAELSLQLNRYSYSEKLLSMLIDY